jgi:tetratricopeptide (TPR) repeat protein
MSLSKWKVVHEKVVRRDAAAKDGKVLGAEVRGTVVVGEAMEADGITWLKSKFKGPDGSVVSYMMRDGAAVGLGQLLEPYESPVPYKVVGERVALRATPDARGMPVGMVGKGKSIFGNEVEVNGVKWVKTEKNSTECYAMVDATDIGVGLLLEKEEVKDPYANEAEATPVQAKLAQAALSLTEALDTPPELEMETRPMALLWMALEVLDSCLHKTMSMDFSGRSRPIEDGMKKAKDCLKQAKEAGDKIGEAFAQDVIAKAYLLKKQADQAMKIAKEAQTAFRANGDKKGEAMALSTLANCACAKAARVMGGARAKTMQNIRPEKLEEFKKLQAEQIEEATKYAEDALFIVKDKDPRAELKATLKTAVVYLTGGNAERAKDVIDEAEIMAKKAKMPDFEKECLNLSVDCAEVHMSRGEYTDAADIASELAAMFKAQENYDKAAAMLDLQIQAHIKAEEGQWALTAAKNDLVRLWKGIDKKKEALALVEVAKIYVGFRDTKMVEKTAKEALKIFEEINEVDSQVSAMRTMMQVYMAEEDKRDLKAAAKVAKECLTLGKTKANTIVEAYGMLWSGTVAAEKFFEIYIPTIKLWRDPEYKGKKKQKDLDIPTYEKAMKQIDKAYLFSKVRRTRLECRKPSNSHICCSRKRTARKTRRRPR